MQFDELEVKSMGGPGSLTFQVEQCFKSLLSLGRSKRGAKKERQARILTETGELVPLPRIGLDEIFSIRTGKTYLNLTVTFVMWCKKRYGIRHVTQIRMAEMATSYVQDKFLARENPSGWTVRTVIAALNKFAAGVQRRYHCDPGRIDRAALGVLPVRDKRHLKQTGEYPAAHAEAIIGWIADLRSEKARLAGLWPANFRGDRAAGADG